jgi:hypothetical protein
VARILTHGLQHEAPLEPLLAAHAEALEQQTRQLANRYGPIEFLAGWKARHILWLRRFMRLLILALLALALFSHAHLAMRVINKAHIVNSGH